MIQRHTRNLRQARIKAFLQTGSRLAVFGFIMGISFGPIAQAQGVGIDEFKNQQSQKAAPPPQIPTPSNTMSAAPTVEPKTGEPVDGLSGPVVAVPDATANDVTGSVGPAETPPVVAVPEPSLIAPEASAPTTILTRLPPWLLIGVSAISGLLIGIAVMGQRQRRNRVDEESANQGKAKQGSQAELEDVMLSISLIRSRLAQNGATTTRQDRDAVLKAATEDLRSLAMNAQRLQDIKKSNALSSSAKRNLSEAAETIPVLSQQLMARLTLLAASNTPEVEDLAIEARRLLKIGSDVPTLEVYRRLLDLMQGSLAQSGGAQGIGGLSDPTPAPKATQSRANPETPAASHGFSGTPDTIQTPDLHAAPVTPVSHEHGLDVGVAPVSTDGHAVRTAVVPQSGGGTSGSANVELILSPLFASLPPLGGARRQQSIIDAVQSALGADPANRKRQIAEALAYDFNARSLPRADQPAPGFEEALQVALRELDVGLELVSARIGDHAIGYDVEISSGLLSGPNQITRFAIADNDSGQVLASGQVAAT